MSKKTVTNTAQTHHDKGPMGMLDLPVFGGSSDDIERMERDGQRQLVESDVIPADIRGQLPHGVTLGDAVPDDPLFRYVTLPAGWTRHATEHDMHSHILDPQGRTRIHVFYKAAFYDRCAHCSVITRFAVEQSYPDPDDYNRCRVATVDRATTPPTIVEEWSMIEVDPSDRGAYYRLLQADELRAVVKLTADRPQWRDSSAYWDEVS